MIDADSDKTHFADDETLKDIAIDTPGWVREKNSKVWTPSHFAGAHSRNASWWADGKTSHSCENRDKFCSYEYTFTKPE